MAEDQVVETHWEKLRKRHPKLRKTAEQLKAEFDRTMLDFFTRIAFEATASRKLKKEAKVEVNVKVDGKKLPVKDDESDMLAVIPAASEADIDEVLGLKSERTKKITYKITLPRRAHKPEKSPWDGKVGPGSKQITLNLGGKKRIVYKSILHAKVHRFFTKMNVAADYLWDKNSPKHEFKIYDSSGKKQIATFTPHFHLRDENKFLYILVDSDADEPRFPTEIDWAALCYARERILVMECKGTPSSKTLFRVWRGSAKNKAARFLKETWSLRWDGGLPSNDGRAYLDTTPTHDSAVKLRRIKYISESWFLADDEIDQLVKKYKKEKSR